MQWDLVIVAPGRLGALAKPGPRGVQPGLSKATVHLQQVLSSEEIKCRARTDIPAYWKWCDEEHECIMLFDSGGFKLQHFNKLSEQFRRDLDGKHWRTRQTPYRNPARASNPGGLASLFAQPATVHTSSFVSLGALYPDKPKRAVEDAGIRAGEIIGYRAWQVDPQWRLHSTFRSKTIWEPSGVVTGDVNEEREGVYAFKESEEVVFYCAMFRCWRGSSLFATDLNGDDNNWPIVFGTVSLWGVVIEHEKGYRASYAAVGDLIGSADLAPDDLNKLRKIYGSG